MRLLASALALGLGLWVASPAAMAAGPRPPEAVRAAASIYYDNTLRWGRDSKDQPVGPQRAPDVVFEPIDISHDGVPDWRVQFDKAPSTGAIGKGWVELYVSRPDGSHVLALEGRLTHPRYRNIDGRFTLDARIDSFAPPCMRNDGCPRRWVWDNALGALIETPARAGQTILEGGPLLLRRMDFDGRWPDNPLTRFPAGSREAVAGEIRKRDRLCRRYDAGAAYDGGAERPVETPDLNGDGKSDWVVGWWMTRCDWPNYLNDTPASPWLPLTILLSQPDGGFKEAWEATVLQAHWGLDVSAAPARVVLLAAPGQCDKEICVKSVLVWTGERFEETASHDR